MRSGGDRRPHPLRLLQRRPSASMLVAMLALFVALGGTTYAVQRLPKRSVGSAQLRRDAVQNLHVRAGAVSRSKIRRKAITAKQVGSDALLGRNVLESSLAKVPDADKLDGRDGSRFVQATRIARLLLEGGDTAVIHRVGPLTLTASCVIDSGPLQSDAARVTLSTGRAGAAFEGTGTAISDLDPLDPPAPVVEATADLAAPDFAGTADAHAVAADGAEIPGLSLHAGVNLGGLAGKCAFGGYVFE